MLIRKMEIVNWTKLHGIEPAGEKQVGRSLFFLDSGATVE